MHKSIISYKNVIDSGLILMSESTTYISTRHSLNLLKIAYRIPQRYSRTL